MEIRQTKRPHPRGGTRRPWIVFPGVAGVPRWCGPWRTRADAERGAAALRRALRQAQKLGID